MLYVSTRNPHDSFTPHRALHEDRTPDGGLYAPLLVPSYSKDDLSKFRSRSFGENIALVLNTFFSTKLTGWDVEFCCGRYPVKTIDLPRRLVVAEAWHNTIASYHFMEQALYVQLCGDNTKQPVTNWAKIAIKIAVLFAVYGSIALTQHIGLIDLAVHSDDFSLPIAAVYARKMGLPLDHIICGTVDNSFAWDLIHRGEISSASASNDVSGLEHMIYLTLGVDAACEFVTACMNRKSYSLNDEQRYALNAGVFAAVISSNRTHSVMSNFYRSHGYALDHAAAVSYAALQDYRARIGESKRTLVFSLTNAAKSAKFSATAVETVE